jgi:hypothetical protein
MVGYIYAPMNYGRAESLHQRVVNVADHSPIIGGSWPFGNRLPNGQQKSIDRWQVRDPDGPVLRVLQWPRLRDGELGNSRQV